MENLDKNLEELLKKSQELKKKMEEFDESILIDPLIPQEIKDHIIESRKKIEEPEPNDGLILTNKIIGYDPENFEPIYEFNPFNKKDEQK